jgi:2-polyprenyl-3-methyl-5-hydroxy-6-metoxy-1,4-benzoquinol methylase
MSIPTLKELQGRLGKSSDLQIEGLLNSRTVETFICSASSGSGRCNFGGRGLDTAHGSNYGDITDTRMPRMLVTTRRVISFHRNFPSPVRHHEATDQTMFAKFECPACDSTFTCYVQDVIGRRTQKSYPQYFCMDCQTFFHRSSYKETEQQKKGDFDFLIGQTENHISIAGQLCLEIKTRFPHIKSCLEIGYGLGWFMQACRNYGMEDVYGFEVNANCYHHAKDRLGLNCEHGLFDENHKRSYDLLASIMVFEHLEKPRDLFKLMISRLNKDGVIYLCVPFFERRDWAFLRTAATAPTDLPDLMHDNDVHINHFSIKGLADMGRSFGARSADFFVSQDTFFKSPGAYPGMLFQF